MNQSKKWIWIIITIVLITIVGYCAYFVFIKQSRPSLKEKIKVGIIMPQSGDLASFGLNVQRGVEIALAKSDIADKVKIITEDVPEFTPASAMSAYRKMVDIDKVDIIIGPFGPAQTLAVAPLIDPSSLTVVSISNCDDRFAQYESLFCVYPGIKDQILNSVEFMRNKGWNNVYLFTEQSELGIQVEEILKTTSGVNLVGVEKVVPNQTTDFRTLIAKMKTAKPDVIYAMFAPNEGFIMLRQYPSLSKGTPLLIGTDINTDQLKDLFGQEAPNIYFASMISEEYENNFANDFKEKSGGNKPDYFAALAHSASVILFNAIDEKGVSKLPKNLINKDFEDAAVPGFKFRYDRTASIPLYTFHYEDGGFIVAK